MEKKLSIALVAALVLVVSSVAFVTTTQQVNASIEDEREDRCNRHHDNQLTGRTVRDQRVEQSRTARC